MKKTVYIYSTIIALLLTALYIPSAQAQHVCGYKNGVRHCSDDAEARHAYSSDVSRLKNSKKFRQTSDKNSKKNAEKNK